MISDTVLQGHNYLFVCFLVWDCAFPVTSNNANSTIDFGNAHHTNTISENKQLLHHGNETQKLELTSLSLDNSSVYDVYKLDENKYKKVKGMQTSSENPVNNSIIISKDDNGKESNLQDNLSDEMPNSSYMIELTSASDSLLRPNQSTIETVSDGMATHDNTSTSRKEDKHTKGYLFNITDNNSRGQLTKGTHQDSILTRTKPKHRIFKHLNLVPIEDEPFGGVLWKNNSKYAMSVCIPIGVGIAGAACIIGMAYAARRCYKNERKIQEIRAAIQQQISANRNDETVLLNSSDEEM